jgi:glycosyltransferase involved in cell wall biosynthesis
LPLRLLVVANTYERTEPFAGGFVHLTEVASRWTDIELVVMGPRSVRDIIENALRPKQYIVIPDFFAPSRAVTWLLRGFAGIWPARRLRSSCDVVLPLSHSLPDTLPAAAFGLSRCVVVLWHFVGSPFHRAGNFLYNSLTYANGSIGKALALRAGAIVVGSHYLADELGISGRENTFVTTNGIEHIKIRSTEERRGTIYIGRFYPTKAVEDLILAWELVHAKLPDEHLLLVGRGEVDYVASLHALIRDRGLEEFVTIRGDVHDTEKGELLSRSKLFAFPSKEEGWGIAVAEAMAAGLPCATYDLPVLREVFPYGRSVAPIGNFGVFADRLLELLENEAIYRERAREAENLGATFTWERASEVERAAIKYAYNVSRSVATP